MNYIINHHGLVFERTADGYNRIHHIPKMMTSTDRSRDLAITSTYILYHLVHRRAILQYVKDVIVLTTDRCIILDVRSNLKSLILGEDGSIMDSVLINDNVDRIIHTPILTDRVHFIIENQLYQYNLQSESAQSVPLRLDFDRWKITKSPFIIRDTVHYCNDKGEYSKLTFNSKIRSVGVIDRDGTMMLLSRESQLVVRIIDKTGSVTRIPNNIIYHMDRISQWIGFITMSGIDLLTNDMNETYQVRADGTLISTGISSRVMTYK